MHHQLAEPSKGERTCVQAKTAWRERALNAEDALKAATERGRGLFLMTRMAADWGIALTSTGKDVWVTLQSSGSTRAESLEEAAKL